MDEQKKALRNRFTDDYPIQVIHSPYFEERLELLNPVFGCLDKWNEIGVSVLTKYHGNINEYLADYGNVRENMLKTIHNNPIWMEYQKNYPKELTDKLANNHFPSTNIYTCEQDGYYFISFDLKSANYQAVRSVDKSIVLNTDSYDEFARKFTDEEYFINSKYTRQVAFGNSNPKLQMMIEKSIIYDIINNILSKIKWLNEYWVLFSVNSDEVIYRLKTKDSNIHKLVDDTLLSSIVKQVYDEMGIIVKCNKFLLKKYDFKTYFSDSIVHVFRKVNKTTIEDELYCCPSIYYPQIYKLINGFDVTDNDLVFYNNHELAKFLQPLELINKN